MIKSKNFIMIILITMLMLLIGTTAALAADSKVTLEGENTAKVGETKKITVKIASDKLIGSVSGTIKTEGNITIKDVQRSIQPKNYWGQPMVNPQTGAFNIVKTEGASIEEIMEIEYTAGNTEGEGRIIISGVNLGIIKDEGQYEPEEIGEISKTIKVEKATEPQDPQDPEEPDPQEKTLTKIEIATKPSKTKYKAGEKFSKAGMTVIAKYSDGTSKEVTNYTYSPNGELKTSDTEITITYNENGISKTAKVSIEVEKASAGGSSNEGQNSSKDNTVAGKDLSDAGVETLIIPISIVTIILLVSYVEYKKYKKI